LPLAAAGRELNSSFSLKMKNWVSENDIVFAYFIFPILKELNEELRSR